MKILITGGSGFIGSNLAEYFLNKGHKVSAVGRSADQDQFVMSVFDILLPIQPDRASGKRRLRKQKLW